MPLFQSCASRDFWDCYRRLPEEVQRAADKQFALFEDDPTHPSLHLKPDGGFWSVRVTDSHRALAAREGNLFFWFWIGSHDGYDRLISGR